MSKTLVIGIVVVVAIFAFGGLFLWQMQSALAPRQQQTPPPVPALQSESINIQQPNFDTSEWQTYHNDEYGFEAMYPNDLLLETSIDSLGRSLTFLTFPEAYLSNTPLTAAQIFLFAYSTKEGSCRRFESPEDTYRFQENVQNDGISFQVGTWSYTPPSFGYEYRTEKDNNCYVITLILDGKDQKLFYDFITSDDHRLDIFFNAHAQAVSTFRFVEKQTVDIERIETQLRLHLSNTNEFGYGVEWMGEFEQIEDVNNDGHEEFFLAAGGAGGTWVGGTSYKILYSPEGQEYFIAAKSFLPSPRPILNGTHAFCTILKEDEVWEGCGDGYLEYVCFSNNLKEENAVFKGYLESTLGDRVN